MTRIAFSTLLGLALTLGPRPLAAEEVKGKVKGVDAENGTIILTIGDADRIFLVPGEAKVYGLVGKKGKAQDVEGGLKGVKPGTEVTLTADAKDGKDLASSIKVEGLAKIKKAKKKNKKAE
jgi:hypothetical protein